MRTANAKYNSPEWIGKKFGRLTVVKPVSCTVGKNNKKMWFWVVRCDCGREKTMSPYKILKGEHTSCGCGRILTSEINAKYNKPEWVGQRFGRLTVIEPVRVSKTGIRSHWEWKCKCDCGNEVVVVPSSIVLGTTRSCGCLAHEHAVNLCKSREGKYSTSEHKKLWWKYSAMKRRCNSKKFARYEDYGGRGIKVCDEWNESFDKFAEWAYSHGYEDGLTIERIDVNGDYCPENCKFITIEEQARNKRNTVWVEYRGETLPLAELCERHNLNYHTIHYRLYHMGMSAEEAIETPMRENVTELAKKCHEHNIGIKTVRDRIYKLGWDEERALTTPVRPQAKKKGRP